MTKPVELTIIGKPGCHLCTDAEAVIADTLRELQESHPNLSVSVVQRNILEDENLAARYADEIPVVLLNGAQHSYWHVKPERLIPALLKEAQR